MTAVSDKNWPPHCCELDEFRPDLFLKVNPSKRWSGLLSTGQNAGLQRADWHNAKGAGSRHVGRTFIRVRLFLLSFHDRAYFESAVYDLTVLHACQSLAAIQPSAGTRSHPVRLLFRMESASTLATGREHVPADFLSDTTP